jgi:hypothetical protein
MNEILSCGRRSQMLELFQVLEGFIAAFLALFYSAFDGET